MKFRLFKFRLFMAPLVLALCSCSVLATSSTNIRSADVPTTPSATARTEPAATPATDGAPATDEPQLVSQTILIPSHALVFDLPPEMVKRSVSQLADGFFYYAESETASFGLLNPEADRCPIPVTSEQVGEPEEVIVDGVAGVLRRFDNELYVEGAEHVNIDFCDAQTPFTIFFYGYDWNAFSEYVLPMMKIGRMEIALL